MTHHAVKCRIAGAICAYTLGASAAWPQDGAGDVLRSFVDPKQTATILYAAGSAPKETRTADAETHSPVLRVKRTDDFEIDGAGVAAPWQKVAWEPLKKRDSGHSYDARFKMLYSKTGIYVLMSGTDRLLTATLREDFLDLWNEDVYEFFFWTDERHPLYFEYEISPLGHELPILIPNLGGKFLGWRPWHYEGERKTRRAVKIAGGDQQPAAPITGWTAEVFVPYKLLDPLANVPPKPGTRWRANFYRVDYDDVQATSWDWARVGPSFHEYQKFGTLVFE